MGVENYNNEVAKILADTEFEKEVVFDISFSPNSEEFLKTFEFYRETLSISKKYDLAQSYIFFLNDTSVNAKAGISNGNNMICINSGLQIWQIQNFLERDEIDMILKHPFANLYQFLDNPINKLMYQLCTHFTFYHELAHLIQKSKNLKDYISERPIEITEFDLTLHKLEIDADSFSAISIAAHLQQYGLKMMGDNISSERMESLIEVFCAGLLLYLISFDSTKLEMYYEQNTHPHPIVRILNVILTITNYLQQSPKLKEKNVIIKHFDVLQKSIDIAEILEKEVFKKSDTEKFLSIINDEKKQIVEYLKKIREFVLKDHILAVDKWNEEVSQ